MGRDHPPVRQLLPQGRWSRKQFLDALTTAFAVHKEPLRTERWTQYDTADCQLSLRRLALFGNTETLVLQAYDTALPLAELVGPRLPGAATDLPPSRLRERLVALIDDLPLVPLLRLQTRRLPIRILDHHHKTTVRLSVEEHTVVKNNQRWVLRPRLWVQPLRGYRKEAKRFVAWCQEQDLIPATQSVYQEAAATHGCAPGKYSVKRPLPIPPEIPVDRAVRRLLRLLLAMVRYNEWGLRQGDDPLYLHDFRVALRRARSLLGQTRAIFPRKAVRRLRKDVAQLGRSTGRVRDLDALLLAQDAYRQRLPADSRSALQPFFAFLQQERRAHYRTLVKTFETKRYRAVIREWEAFANQPEADARPTPAVTAFVRERIVEQGRALVSVEPDSLQSADPERLHDLRIECKKIRYLLDSFLTAFPELPVRRVLKHLKRVQRTLGRIQDISVQEGMLRQFNHATPGFAFDGTGTPQALEALRVSLISDRQVLQPQVVEEFRALTVVIARMLPASGPECAETAGVPHPRPQPEQDTQRDQKSQPLFVRGRASA